MKNQALFRLLLNGVGGLCSVLSDHVSKTSLGPAVDVHYMRLCVFSSNVDTALLLPVRGTKTDQASIWLLHIVLSRR